MIGFYCEELSAPRPTPKLEYHPFSAVRGFFFNIFAATLPIGSRSSIHSLRALHAVVTVTHLSRVLRDNELKPMQVPTTVWWCCVTFQVIHFLHVVYCLVQIKAPKPFPVHAVKAYNGSEGIAPLILNLCLDEGACSDSRHAHFIPGNETPYLLYRMPSGLKSLLGHFGEERNLLPLLELEPRTI